LACASPKELVSDAGAIRVLYGPTIEDHSPVFRAAISRAIQTGNGVVTVAAGTYRTTSLVWDGQIGDSLVIRGEERVILNCTDTFGVRLKNSRIVPAAGRKKVFRLSVQSLSEPYAFLAREYDVTIRNVEYLGELSSRNGFNVFTCRDFLVDNCVTHEVSSSAKINSFRVANSRIGRLRCDTNEFSVYGTEFNEVL
jgi:hypothetical protein